MFKIEAHALVWAKELLKPTGRSDQADSPVNPFRTQFDLYYLCLLIGILSGRQLACGSDLKDMTRTFPEAYFEYRHLIAGLLLASELKTAGLPIEKRQVQRKVVEFLRSDTQTFLSAEAVELMNGYAAAGFEIMRENLPKPPSEPHEFLIWYHEEMIPAAIAIGPLLLTTEG